MLNNGKVTRIERQETQEGDTIFPTPKPPKPPKEEEEKEG